MTNYPKVGIGVLLFNEANNLLLGKRLNSHGEFSWGPPGGHLEFGESFEDCGRRELEEETGLHVNEFKFLSITNDVFHQEQRHYVSIFLVAKCSYCDKAYVDRASQNRRMEMVCFGSVANATFFTFRKFIKNNDYGSAEFYFFFINC